MDKCEPCKDHMHEAADESWWEQKAVQDKASVRLEVVPESVLMAVKWSV